MFKADYTPEQVDAFVDALQLFGIGYSWAGPDEGAAVDANVVKSGAPIKGAAA